MIRRLWPIRSRTPQSVPEGSNLSHGGSEEHPRPSFGIDEVRITDPDVSVHGRLIAFLFAGDNPEKLQEQRRIWRQRIEDTKNHRVQAAIATSGVLLIGAVSVGLNEKGGVKGVEAVYARAPSNLSGEEATVFQREVERRLLLSAGVMVEEIPVGMAAHNDAREADVVLH